MIYDLITWLAGPLLRRHVRLRAMRGKEDPNRLAERFGIASLPRPAGRLIWFHAASVGEAIALLALITAIQQRYPNVAILITTGTVSSANILAKRLPPNAIHHYVPLDRRVWVEAFLDHWQPDAAIWTESEIWPNMLWALARRNVQSAMVNGRLSAGSARNWRFLRGTFQKLLGVFSVRLAQSEADAERFSQLGITFRHVGNLKFAIEPAPSDAAAEDVLRSAIGNRPFWLAASTHPGEEAIVLAAHKTLAVKHPDLLTIIVPRHPERGPEIAVLTTTEGLQATRRATGKLPTGQTEIYLGDTLGELGIFYELSPIGFIGGSLTFDGHSPIEAAQRSVAIVYGPRMQNNASIAQKLEEAGGACRIKDSSQLAEVVAEWLGNPVEAQAVAHKAKQAADAGNEVVGRILTELQPIFTRMGLD